MKKIAIRLFLALGGIILIWAVGFYCALTVFSVTVVNQTNSVLTDVAVDLSGNVLHLGSIAPGGSARVHGQLKISEGDATLSFHIDGRSVRERVDSYLIDTFACAYTVTVRSPGSVSVLTEGTTLHKIFDPRSGSK